MNFGDCTSSRSRLALASGSSTASAASRWRSDVSDRRNTSSTRRLCERLFHQPEFFELVEERVRAQHADAADEVAGAGVDVLPKLVGNHVRRSGGERLDLLD